MDDDRPVILGLLAGIAGGKSTLARLLADRGALVLDADAAVREAYREPALVDQLAARFGPRVRAADGSVDRAAIADVVFGSDAPDALADLEALVHPAVQSLQRRRLEAALAERSHPAVILDVPLLLEKSPLAKHCDQLIFVDTPADIRQQRATSERGWSAGELARREAHQWPVDRKRSAADVVLRNDGEVSDLAARLDEWLSRSGGFEGLPRRPRDHNQE